MPIILNRALRSAGVLPLVLLTLFTTGAYAQNDAVSCPDAKNPSSYQTFFLHHSVDHDQFLEIQTLLRNQLNTARITSVLQQSALGVCGTPAELQLAQKIISDLDRPHKTWRLTFSFTHAENGQHAPAQQVSMIATNGQRTELRQGNRVPLVTGNTASDTPATQVQYIDAGLNIAATVTGNADALELHTKVEQSSVADEKSGIGAQDPIIHQTVLDVTAWLTQGKPLVLGSLDLPGTSRHEEVQVIVEPVS